MLFWFVTVWDGNDEIDHLFFNGNDPQEDVIQYMLERVYGSKLYDFAKDMTDGDDVIVIHDSKVVGGVNILATNLTADITIRKEKFNHILDLGYCPCKMTVTELVE